MRTSAVVLASDPQLRGGFAPAWASLAGRPVCAWALAALAAEPAIARATLVVYERRRSQAEALIAEAGWRHVASLALPATAATFSAQLRHAHRAGAWSTGDQIMLHDGARPIVTSELLRSLLARVGPRHIIAAAVPMKETLKWADAAHMIRATPARSSLWSVITPLVLPHSAMSALLAAPAADPAARMAAAHGSLARWVATSTGYPLQLVNAGHDDSVVRERGDLAALTEQMRR